MLLNLTYQEEWTSKMHRAKERLQRLGLQSLQRRRLRVDLITTFKTFTGLLDVDLNSFFLPPTPRGLRGHSYEVLQRTSHRRRRGSVFSMRGVKYWNKLPASVITAPFVKSFKKRLEKVWTVLFPHLPHWQKFHHPNSLTLPFPRTARHPLTVSTFICCPNPCFVYVVFFRPVVVHCLPL